jgi:hypothetical protein
MPALDLLWNKQELPSILFKDRNLPNTHRAMLTLRGSPRKFMVSIVSIVSIDIRTTVVHNFNNFKMTMLSSNHTVTIIKIAIISPATIIPMNFMTTLRLYLPKNLEYCNLITPVTTMIPTP